MDISGNGHGQPPTMADGGQAVSEKFAMFIRTLEEKLELPTEENFADHYVMVAGPYGRSAPDRP